MPMVLNNSGDYPYWEYKPSPEEQAAFDQQFFSGLDPNAWVEGPNTGPKNFMERLVSVGAPLALGAMAGYGALGAAGMLGSEALGGGAAVAPGAEGAASWLPSSVIDTGTMSQIAPLYGAEGMTSAAPWSAAGAGSPWAAYASGAGGGLIPTAVNAGSGWLGNAAGSVGAASPVASTAPVSGTTAGGSTSVASQLERALGLPAGTLGTVGGAAGSLLGGQSNTGSLLGGLLGAGLGYLDAKNQPNSLTIKNEIDPRLANLWYGADGTGGIAGQAANLYASQQGQPNPLMQAGQQISGMAGQTPDWATLVSQAKGQWDSNPWVQQQQDAITKKLTQNLLQNVMPGISSGAELATGYGGGTREGIAQGLAISNMNTDLAPALANLASNAYENSQNRALSSAGAAGNYGLSNQAQQAGLLGTGATMQSNAPWANLNNFRTTISGAPGNSSTTQPLFNNTTAGAAGGAVLGNQILGSVNWNDLFKTIGGWNWPFGSQNTTGVF